MAGERSSILPIVAIVVLIVSGALVLTAFGWYAALNALIPLVMALMWLAVFALACWGAGDLVFRRWFGAEEPRLDHTVTQFLGGAAILAAAAGVLGFIHILNSVTLLVVLGAFCCHGALRIYRSFPLPATEVPGSPRWPWLIVGIAGALSLAAATTFAPFYDQWHYHLGFPYHWLRAGSLVTFPRQAYSFFPSNMGLLYLYGLAGPGAWAAQVTHWWMGALTAAGSAAVARRLGAPAFGQILAAALFAATPSVVQIGALAAADLGVAAFAAGSIIALLKLQSDPDRHVFWAAVSGAFAGLAAGTKYLALASVVMPTAIAAVFAALTLTANGPSLLRRTTRTLVPFVVALVAVTSPWFARNAIETRNPVHPYFASVFGQTETDDQVAAGIGTFALDRGAVSTALSLGTFNRRGHAGDIGPVHLWLMPLVFIWMWRHRDNKHALLVFGVFILGLVAWATGPPLGRYLLPSLVLTSALAGASWCEFVGRSEKLLRGVLATLLFLLLAANCNPIRGEYLGGQLACFLGFQSDELYLRENCTQLDAIRAANNELPAEARVLMVGEPRPYGLDRDVVVEDQFRTPLLVEIAESASSAPEITRRLQNIGITHLLWNGAEADRIATADGRHDYLACSSTETRARLDRFLKDELSAVASGPGWEVASLSAE
jgi:hypothetical protein